MPSSSMQVHMQTEHSHMQKLKIKNKNLKKSRKKEECINKVQKLFFKSLKVRKTIFFKGQCWIENISHLHEESQCGKHTTCVKSVVQLLRLRIDHRSIDHYPPTCKKLRKSPRRQDTKLTASLCSGLPHKYQGSKCCFCVWNARLQRWASLVYLLFTSDGEKSLTRNGLFPLSTSWLASLTSQQPP